MDRRGLFKRLGVAAVAVAVGAPTLPAASETDAIRTLVEDVLAHPGKHPEIMADARRLMGERIGAGESSRRVSAVAVGVSAAPQVEADEDGGRANAREVNAAVAMYNENLITREEFMRAVAGGDKPTITVDTHTYVAWTAAPELTFDDLVADCKARGCNLERDYDILGLRHRYAHWLDGDRLADDTLTTADTDLEPVAAWLDGLHERIDRIHGEERIHEAAPTTRHWTYTPPNFMPTAMTATSASFGLYSRIMTAHEQIRSEDPWGGFSRLIDRSFEREILA